MRVYKTNDAGETWTPLTDGLPQENVFDCVLRDCFCSSGEKLAFGTTGGKAFFTDDNGATWQTVAEYLPRISCVRIIGE
jgi:photosystem II stability/assembly factor-like uncharacterized protein